MSDDVLDLARVPIHLGRGATATACEPFDGSMEWYSRYTEATATDGHDGRLVSWHSFSTPWDMWEMHPNGHEVVVCVSGSITLHQEIDGHHRAVTLGTGQAIVNEPGVWHTADVDAPATAMFITAGAGTEHRPR